MEQTTAKHTPLRQVTHDTQQTFPAKTRQDTNTKIIETTHNPVRFQNSTQQQTTVVATPSRLHAQVRTTSTKSVAQPVNTSSPVERSLDKHSASISRPQRQQLQAAIYTGTPQGQPARRVAPQSKPVSKSTRKVAQTKSSRNPRVASQKLSPEVLAFLKLLREKIQRHRKYPRVAKRLGYHGVTTVAFSLSQGGDLTLLKVSEPSGHDILDQAALNAIKKVLPLKPPSMMGNTAIEIPVSFELQR
ncbi:MAG: hypothetical protein NPIRA02_31380 [Nitrospirales bacterium]|nr:MAG: hypothetical protein NPIRA02_31380 [Nitrospirales bacterium]